MQGQIPQRCVDKESAMIKRSREILALLEKNVYKWSFFSILNCFCSGKRFFSTKMIAKRNLVSSQSEFVYERVFFNGNEKKMWKNVWNGIKTEKKHFKWNTLNWLWNTFLLVEKLLMIDIIKKPTKFQMMHLFLSKSTKTRKSWKNERIKKNEKN